MHKDFSEQFINAVFYEGFLTSQIINLKILEMISETIKKITKNFEEGFHSKTLIGWQQNYDKNARPLNHNPNFMEGRVMIEGKEYWFIKKGWIVKIWDKKISYTSFFSDETYIEVVDLTPDYIKAEGEKLS